MNRIVKSQLILVFFVAYFLSFELQAQKALELSKANRKIVLNIDKRVKYKLKGGFVDVGRIQSIGENSFVVNERIIQINDVSMIGRKGGGSNFFGIFLTSLGGVAFFSALENLSYDPCPSCQGTTSTDSSVGPGIAATIVVAAVGIVILSRNKTKKISDWSLKIIDKPAK